MLRAFFNCVVLVFAIGLIIVQTDPLNTPLMFGYKGLIIVCALLVLLFILNFMLLVSAVIQGCKDADSDEAGAPAVRSR